MNHVTYRRALNGLGIVPNLPIVMYSNPIEATDWNIGPRNYQAAFEFAKTRGFTDIIVRYKETLPTLVGPADVVYLYSPRSVIEGRLNPFMPHLKEQQVLDFWNQFFSLVIPNFQKFGSIQNLIHPSVSVIPNVGSPAFKFYSIAKGGYFDKVPFKEIELCASAAGQQYSQVNGPVIIKSPAGELASVMHSVAVKDLPFIEQCRGLAWSSFAVRQGIHEWPAAVTFYLDARILLKNLGYRKYSPTRQKGVQIAAWDNWTLRPGAYKYFQALYKKGMTEGDNGTGFMAAEYLAYGLDTTKFEGGINITNLEIKGQIQPIHTWDQLDDALLNLARGARGESQMSRFKGAKYEEMGVYSYVELKVIDFIPLSDIPLCVIHGTFDSANPTGVPPEEIEQTLRNMGFAGTILKVKYKKSQRSSTINSEVQNWAYQNRRIIEAYPSKTSGFAKIKNKEIVRPAKFITLPNGLIVSDIEATQNLYKSIMGDNPSENTDSGNLPVDSVNFFDAVKFCNRLTDLTNQRFGYNRKKAYTIEDDNVIWDPSADGWRLPTAAEFKYAAAGGAPNDPYDFIGDISWNGQNSGGKSHEVGQKMPNQYGLYDMLGNVSEWIYYTSDSLYFPQAVAGGSFESASGVLRSSYIVKYDAPTESPYFGFRIYRNGPGYIPAGVAK